MKSSSGNGYCEIHEEIIDAKLGLMGQAKCKYDSHATCPIYLANQRRLEKLESEREKILSSLPFSD